ncbi:hypothetical protein N9J01_00335 [bacterium]|nr:hypothetical protein [bacterium]
MTTKVTDKNISNIANKFVQWQSVITADGSTATNATAGQGYFIDTTSNTHTINLPSSPSIGDSVAIKDYAGTFATNNLTISRNGKNIQGVANDSLISSARAGLTLVYVDSTRGWVYSKESNVADLQQALFVTATGGTVSESGNFKIHSFTGDGCFVVSAVGNSAGSDKVDYLVVAGGGGGGNDHGGGGGAGGHRTTFPSPGCNAGAFPISTTTYPITVGAGGTAAGPSGPPGNAAPSGGDSIFSTITSSGGGGGGNYPSAGGDGGSGGGGNGPSGSAGSGNTPPTSPPQGNDGGVGNAVGNQFSAGGGGAGAVGFNAGTGTGSGNGGNGLANSITGSSVTRGGGGGGGSNPVRGTGGTGGGGDGGSPSGDSTAGTANTGGGGGGSANGPAPAPSVSRNGGSGIVIIRYKFQ